MGNILCIIGIVIAFLSLSYPWYTITTDIQVTGYETGGMTNMLTIDGMNGVQIQVPGLTGPVAMGSFTVPFALLIAIGLVFLIIATIGISQSKKLGKKYVLRGIKLLVPILLIIIVIMSLRLIPFESMVGTVGGQIGEIIEMISASPAGGEHVVTISDVGEEVVFQWGFGLGGLLLLLSGLLLIISGWLEYFADADLFAARSGEKTKKSKKSKEEDIAAMQVFEEDKKE